MNPSRIDFQINLAEVFVELGKTEKAVECYEMAEKTSPESAELYSSWGITLQKSGEHFEAVYKFEKSLKLKLDQERTKYYYAISLAEIGELDRSEKLLLEVLEKNSRFVEAYIKLGSIACIKGDLNIAIERYKEAAKYPLKKTEANYLVASAYTLLDNYSEAIEYYKKAIENDMDHVDSYVGYAVALSELENDAEALRKIRRARKLAPNSSQVNMIYGVILLKDEKCSRDALEKLENALIIEPTNIPALVGKAEALIKLKRLDEALSFLHEILFKLPDFGTALFLTGCAYEEKGDISSNPENYETALKFYEKTLEKEPHHIGAISSIAYIKAKSSKDTQFFENELKRLWQVYPDKRNSIKNYFKKSIEKLDYHKGLDDIIA
jgi:tetratricopeptide (TPR) repeat protein